jgi:hypothetical protein
MESGSSLKLECIADGLPVPTVKWYKVSKLRNFCIYLLPRLLLYCLFNAALWMQVLSLYVT